MAHAPLIIDIAGAALTRRERERLRNPFVGGVILFGRNWESRTQLTRLCASIKKMRPDLLICVDHEGGRVQRFRTDGFTHLPPMHALGELWERDPMRALEAATACGSVLGSELRACGVDLALTPVLDLDWQRSGVIGDRALHRNPRVVAQLARSLMLGLLQAGMANCGKHFPGHGFASADSHHGIARDRRALATLLRTDAAPYGWLGTALAAVMPAHVIYPRVDTRPAGFSARWLRGILRGQLGFAGAIVSDDLSMAAARQINDRAVTPAEAVTAALDAGCDLALLCNQSLDTGSVIDEVLEQLARAPGKQSRRAAAASERRRLALLPVAAAPSWNALMSQERYRGALARLP